MSDGANLVQERAFAFAVRIVKLNVFLRFKKKEYDLAKLVLHSGTAVGVRLREAAMASTPELALTCQAQALKDARETEYWLLLLRETGYLTPKEAESILTDAQALIALLDGSAPDASTVIPEPPAEPAP